MNLQQILQFLQTGGNPKQLAMLMIKQRMGETPIGQNLISLAEKGDTKALEEFARNLAAQQGINFDKEFASFKNNLKI